MLATRITLFRPRPKQEDRTPKPDVHDKPSDEKLTACSENQAQEMPPIYRYKKGCLSVTDFSAQAWCEKALELYLLTGRKRETQAMRDGTARHEAIEAEVHDVKEVEVETREDEMGFKFLNSILAFQNLRRENDRVREVWIGCPVSYGGTYVIRGIIDELRVVNDQIVIGDTKTRRVEKEPSAAQKRTSALQVQLYHWLIDHLKEYGTDLDWSEFYASCRVDPLRRLEHEELRPFGTLRNITEVYLRALRSIPTLAPYCEIEYDCDGKIFHIEKVVYSEASTVHAVDSYLEWWAGYRESSPVMRSEAWKCRMCEYLPECSRCPLDPEDRLAEIDRREQMECLSQDLEDIGV